MKPTSSGKITKKNHYEQKVKIFRNCSLRDALEDVQKTGLSLRRAAAKWNIDKSTLSRYKINPERSFHRPPTMFTRIEEERIVKWIEISAKRGVPHTRQDILIEAYRMNKQKRGDSATAPGVHWYNLFKRRHQLKVLKPETLSRASGNLAKSNILGWFRQVEDGLKEEQLEHLLLDPSRIYNADESGLLRNPSSGKVVVTSDMKSVFELNKDAKASLTVMLTIRADAKTCRPFILYPHKRIPAAIAITFPHEAADVSVSDNGWMTSDTFCQYLRLLAEQAKADGVDLPNEKILLFVDNHTSHTTLDSCEMAAELGIVLITFYPNATFLYQPCDKTCFR